PRPARAWHPAGARRAGDRGSRLRLRRPRAARRGGRGAARERPFEPAARLRSSRAMAPTADPSRGAIRIALGAGLLVCAGVVLVLGAGFAFLWASGGVRAAGEAALAGLAVLVALALIFAPSWRRLARSLAAERSERIRSQERADVGAHLHDSVLQTLALIQRNADDPRQVATLARQQERELRAWLTGRDPGRRGESVAAALEAAA